LCQEMLLHGFVCFPLCNYTKCEFPVEILINNDRNSKSQTIDFWSYLRFGYCNLILVICYFRFIRVLVLRELSLFRRPAAALNPEPWTPQPWTLYPWTLNAEPVDGYTGFTPICSMPDSTVSVMGINEFRPPTSKISSHD
jgi:hypothetical protein